MNIRTKIKRIFDSKKEVSSTIDMLKSDRPVEKKILHQHIWKVVGKTYAPPSNINFSNDQVPSEVLEKMAFGVTTILWDCVCGDTKKEELLGSDEDLLESLIDKADKIGPQFIDRRGKTFIVSEWKTQPQNPGMIPLK